MSKKAPFANFPRFPTIIVINIKISIKLLISISSALANLDNKATKRLQNKL